jgi:lipid-binding SYLF domain-containing protein
MTDLDNETVQVVAIIGVIALGVTAMVVDGEIGETIAVAVATGLGAVIGYLFKNRGGETDATEEV